MHSWKRGMTEMKIIIEMQKEQIGSAMCQSITMMSIEDVITLTLPRVSASTCKPIPVREDGEVRVPFRLAKICLPGQRTR